MADTASSKIGDSMADVSCFQAKMKPELGRHDGADVPFIHRVTLNSSNFPRRTFVIAPLCKCERWKLHGTLAFPRIARLIFPELVWCLTHDPDLDN